MQAKVEIVSLEFAKQLLASETPNRPVSAKTVQRYASDMKAGRWNNNGQGICITPDGKLLDGQHRMHAVILSQTPTAMLVVRGVPPETFTTMDSGKHRSLSDVLAIEGHLHTNTLAGAARLVYNYAAGTSSDYNPTKATLEAFVNAHPYCAKATALVHGERVKFPRSPFAAVLWLGNEREYLNDEATSFIEGVFFGEGLFKGDARHTLREWIIAQQTREHFRLTSGAAFGAIARAWNAYASGKELSAIKRVTNFTQASLKVYGFERSTYRDVPDIVARAAELRRGNLDRGRNNKSPLTYGQAA